MDKLRDVMAFLTKYGFWLSCAGIALVVLGLWYHTTGVLREETLQNQSDIKASVAAMNQIKNTLNHPNTTTDEYMQAMLKMYAIDVGQGWQTVYARQKNVLVWPKSLGTDFDRAVKDLRPIEVVPYPTPPNKEIRAEFRQRYRDWIVDEIPKLADKIKAEWSLTPKDPVTQPAFRGSEGRNPNEVIEVSPYLVDWAPANQAEIMQEHFAFTSAVSRIPSTLDVLYAQETLWVLDSLVGIIKDVNGDAEARYQTSIHAIEGIQVGRSAGGVGGQVTPVVDQVGPDAPGASSESGFHDSPLPVAPTEGGSPDMRMEPGAQVDPAQGRYVDQNFMPLQADRLRLALTNTPGSPEDVVLAVAKRMPVRLRLKMDQRKVDVLLAACGNSPLPLEVRQIRINRAAVSANSSGGGGYPALSGGGGEGGRMMPNYGEGGRGGGGTQIPGKNVNEITIEVFGIVYIYNPENASLLGIDPKLLKAPPKVPPVIDTTGAPVAAPLAAAAAP